MQEQLVIESHGKRDLNQMRSLRLPSEDPRIERPLYMKGEIRPPEMVCQGFMPWNMRRWKNRLVLVKIMAKGAKIDTHVPRVEALVI